MEDKQSGSGTVKKAPKKVQFQLPNEEDTIVFQALERFKQYYQIAMSDDYAKFKDYFKESETEIPLSHFNDKKKMRQLLLETAIMEDNPDAIEYMVKNGAKIQDELYDEGFYALELAVYHSKFRSVECLLKMGLSVTKVKNKEIGSPIKLALNCHNSIMFRKLFRKGQAVNIVNLQDRFGYTLLHYALLEQQYKIAHFLLKNKASSLLKNDLGETPLMLAAKTGNIDLVILLLLHGADPSVSYMSKFIAAQFVPNNRNGYEIERMLHAFSKAKPPKTQQYLPQYIENTIRWSSIHREIKQKWYLHLYDSEQQKEEAPDEDLDMIGKMLIQCRLS